MDTNKIKKGLGRGLSSLIGETKAEIQKNRLSVSDLVPNKYQPRKIFDEENLNELANSIKERGILQPIIVRKSDKDQSKFEIIAGERRWLAAQKVGLHDVPVVVAEADDLKSLEFAIVENVQRHDLNPLRGLNHVFVHFQQLQILTILNHLPRLQLPEHHEAPPFEPQATFSLQQLFQILIDLCLIYEQ